jgi:F-type H+-transporting ATPase subunit b
MHIDWFVFFAQIVNFLILLFLLKKFLYGRIISAIDAREARIAATFAEAEKSKEEARTSALDYEKRLQELQGLSEEMLNKARVEAEAYRSELMDKVREDVESIQNRWLDTLRSERENFFQELRKLAGNQVYAVTRRVLKDLADIDLDERIVQVLRERIETLNLDERQRIKDLMTGGESITIQSAFQIPVESRAMLTGAIHRIIGEGIDVAFETSDDVVSGYELRVNGYKIAWSMKDYLDTLEEKFYRVLYEESREHTHTH